MSTVINSGSTDPEVIRNSVVSTIIPEWMEDANFKEMARNFRAFNPDVKAKEVVYIQALKEVATAIDMLNSNIAPLESEASEFVISGRSYKRTEYTELIPSSLAKLVAPRAITYDGVEERYGRINLRAPLNRKASTDMVTPIQLRKALAELARYANKTYSVNSEATDGKDVAAIANVNIAGTDRCTNADTLPVDIVGASAIIANDRAYGYWIDVVMADILQEAVKF